MMICVVIKGPTFQEAHQQISKALVYADLIELRLDCFNTLDLAALKNLRSHFSIPMIFTLRSHLQGGNYTRSEKQQWTDIRRLLELKPEYLDLEHDVSVCFFEEILSQHPETKLIISYHNFIETPENLEAIYQEMQKKPAFFYKIAVTAQNCLDALRLICWKKKSDGKLIAISMGSHGQISRVLGSVIGCPMTYAALEENQKSAPGQLSAKTLIERYHYRSLNSDTKIYGLIGDPIDQSISDETHNRWMMAHGINAVYVKIQIRTEELSHFLPFAKRLPFHGLSVTMPLKEHILPFLDDIDSQARDMGAVNTLVFKEEKIFGFNTDGIGALNAIEMQYLVKSKRIVIIGAGGAARAIAYEAHRRGALVTIVNRNAEKANQIAQRLNSTGKGLDYLETCAEVGYDVLINCTPASHPISSNHLLSQAIVMDIMTKPKETAFLKLAIEKNCSIVYGYQMFIEQALGQFNLWFKGHFDIQKSRQILEKESIGSLLNNTVRHEAD